MKIRIITEMKLKTVLKEGLVGVIPYKYHFVTGFIGKSKKNSDIASILSVRFITPQENNTHLIQILSLH